MKLRSFYKHVVVVKRGSIWKATEVSHIADSSLLNMTLCGLINNYSRVTIIRPLVTWQSLLFNMLYCQNSVLHLSTLIL